MLKIVADDKIPFLRGALEPYAEMKYIPGSKISRADFMNSDALLIRTRTKCSMNLLEGTRVKFIGTATIGFDHIDTKYCDSKGIRWTNAPGCNSSSVQQYISAALLRISGENSFQLKDKTLGIIGVGNVGSKVEMFARTIGMNVLLNDPPRERLEGSRIFHNLDKVLSESDIVTVHVPLNLQGQDRTYHLFNEESLKKIKKGAWLINSSRGEVADTFALKQVLNSGRLGGAIIDVWENEPDIDLELMRLSLISTPHIAGYSADGKANGTAIVVNSLSKYFNIPIKNWYPENVPPPAFPHISIDCRNKSEEEMIRQVVSLTYNIDADDLRFRNSPADFEKLRGDYPLRREFTSYSVKLINSSGNIQKIIASLGFKTGG